MVQLASLAAALIFLVPVFVFVALRAREDSELWELALDIPLAIAVDLFSVMTLAFVLELGLATLVSRALWLAGGVTWLVVRRQHRPRWPKQLTPRVLFSVAVAAATAVTLSMQVSRTYSIFDRWWHIPLVASIGGQTMPFHNVLDPHQRVFYHFSGDVHAAMLQATSFDVIHSALALSLAHDIQFGLIGCVLGLVFSWAGFQRIAAFVLGPLAILAAGPMTIFRDGVRTAQHGYSIINLLSLSFRPHMALGDLLLIGFVTTVVVRVTADPAPPPAKTVLPLVAITATLAITDEASLGVIALALGLVWLVWPEVVHPTRMRGLLVFGGLAVALVLPNLLFSGALNPGSQHHKFTFVPLRSPGCYTPVLPLGTKKGQLMLFYDVFPTAAVVVGMGLHFLTRRRARARGILLVLGLVTVTLSVLLLTGVDMDHQPVENHRFMLVSELVAPLLGMLCLAPGRSWIEKRSKASPYAIALVVTGMLAGALSTGDWLYGICPGWAATYKKYWANIDHYQVDCRTDAGARLGTRPVPTYLDRSLAYLYSGCVPLYTAGERNRPGWKLLIGAPEQGMRAVDKMKRWPIADRGLRAVCPQGNRQRDPVCRRAVASGTCRDVGRYAQLCRLPQ